MTTLVVGASGATGRLLVEQLLEQGEKVRIVVRSVDSLPDSLIRHDRLSITEASLMHMSDAELLTQVEGCDAVVSCLGHNLTFKGMFGQPRRLVTDAVKRLGRAIDKSRPGKPVKYILMNSSGNQNRQAGEKITTAQSVVIGLIRLLVAPHADNEAAAAYLQTGIASGHSMIEWVAVRPDSLVNHESVTQYDVYPSPIRSAIFDSGNTSRINVAHFMSQLVLDDNTWQQWKGQMPVIYNASA